MGHDRASAYIGREAEALAVGQSQELVVIQHRVQVLHPLRVHVAVEDDPLALLQLAPHVVDDPVGGSQLGLTGVKLSQLAL